MVKRAESPRRNERFDNHHYIIFVVVYVIDRSERGRSTYAPQVAFGGRVGVTSNISDRAVAGAGSLALQWLESVDTALLLVDSNLSIHWANPLARNWLKSNEPLCEIRNQLHVGRSQQQLRTLLRRADKDLDGISVRIDGRGAHLIVTARRISKKDEEAFYGLIARRTDQLDTKLLGVDEAFRLTSAEGRVLQELIRGQTAQSIAPRLGVSVETVRTHIRSVYTKLEVGSREALFMRLRPFMIVS